MTDPVSLVTGANSGLGLETALGLAIAGHTVVMTSRDPARGQAAVADVASRSGNPRVELLLLDLASLASVRRAAAELLLRHPTLSVLVNNAGVLLGDRRPTEDGFEGTIGTNHLGPFLLTALLRPALARGSRVVTVSSAGHQLSPRGLRLDDLQWTTRSFHGVAAYGESKLANILFTRELARRTAAEGVIAHALHPGMVRTNLAAEGDGAAWLAFGMRLVRPFLLSPARGAKTSLHCALSDDAGQSTGEYWVRSKRRRPARAGRNDEAAARLWEMSERLVGL